MRWLVPAVIAFAAVQVLAGIMLRDRSMLVIGVMLCLYGGCCLMAKIELAGRRPGPSVAWVCGGLVVPSIVILLAQPALLPTVVLVPLMAAALGLPFVSEGLKLPALGFSLLWLVTLLVLGRLVPLSADATAWYWTMFVVASSAMTAVLTLLLFAQYRSRLLAAVDRERHVAERLRELDLLKSTLLMAASHDLRTPTTTIIGAASTLERLEVGTQDARILAGAIVRSGQKLAGLLDDLLGVEALESGLGLSVESRDLGAVAHDAIESMDLPPRPLLVIDREPATVLIDPAKVARVVDNLVLNALRHARGAGTVWVRVRAKPGGAELVVEDDGPGVSNDEREAIFAPFHRGRTNAPGSGLGLSIVSGFVGLHGGRVWVEERSGGGASFHAFFPATGPENDELRSEGEANDFRRNEPDLSATA